MKYKLSTASFGYSHEEAEKLKKLGFQFKERVSNWDDSPLEIVQNPCESDLTIEINTLQDLQALIKEHGKIVIDEDSIIIYDGYLE